MRNDFTMNTESLDPFPYCTNVCAYEPEARQDHSPLSVKRSQPDAVIDASATCETSIPYSPTLEGTNGVG